MRILTYILLLFFYCSCATSEKSKPQEKSHNYISLKSELIDSIGITFYDDRQVLHQNDSTFIIYPEGNNLVFYHFESRTEVKRITFSVPVENMESFSVASANDLAIYYGQAIILYKGGKESIIELGNPPENLFWRNDIFGFEYFPKHNIVVLGLSGGKWPGLDNLDYFLRGLCAFNLETKEIVRLPFEFSSIYRTSEYWGAELYTSRQGDTLVVSENWSENVSLIDLNSFEISQFEVRHPNESLRTELPENLEEYPSVKPQEGDQKTEKYALWELRHFNFEKYYKAFLSEDGSTIYRFYQHRRDMKGENIRIASTNTKALSVVKYNIATDNTATFELPTDRFYMTGRFWLKAYDEFEHIKFVYTKERNPDRAVYLLDQIQLFTSDL